MSNLKLFGLIGESLKHSFSERYFKEKFAKLNMQNCDYRNFELNSIEEFKEIVRLFPELRAVNVTMPFKEKIIPLLDFIDDEAKKIGAVNVVVIKRYDKKTTLKGYNTDTYGIEVTLLHNLKTFDLKALILGTGGAAKAVKYVLDKFKIKNDFVSRTKQIGVKYTYPELDKNIIESHKLIINTTPLGMFPNVDACPDIPYQYLTNQHFLIDLIYNPPITAFLRKGKEAGAIIANGQEMLVSQAEKSWELFCSE